MTDELVTGELIHGGTEPRGSATTHGTPAESDRNSLSLSPNGPLLQRALRYWRNVDEAIGRRIADQVEHTGSTISGSATDPEAASRSEEVTAS